MGHYAWVEHVENIRNTLSQKDDELKELREKRGAAYVSGAFLDFYPKDIFKHPYTKTKMGVDSSSNG